MDKVNHVCREAGFKLHDWVNFGPGQCELPIPRPRMSDLDPKERGYSWCPKCFGSEKEGIFVKALGHLLCRACDSFCSSFEINLSRKRRNQYVGHSLRYGMDVKEYVNKFRPISKRQISQVSGATWDITNYLLPVATTARFLFRRVCLFSKTPLGWDDPIDPEMEEQVVSTLQNMMSAHAIMYPRMFFPSVVSNI